MHISICYDCVRNSEISSMNDNGLTQIGHRCYVNSITTNDSHLICFFCMDGSNIYSADESFKLLEYMNIFFN